jgi:hypothetical protein
MKHIKLFESFFDRFNKLKSDEQEETHYDKYGYNGVFTIMTQELNDRTEGDFSMEQDSYQIEFNSREELNELQRKYPVGGEYKGETIIDFDYFT